MKIFKILPSYLFSHTPYRSGQLDDSNNRNLLCCSLFHRRGEKLTKHSNRLNIKPWITGLLQKSHEITKPSKLYYYQIMNGLLTKFFGPWNDYFTYTKHIISSSQRSHPAASLLFVRLSLHNNNKLKNELECTERIWSGRVWLQRERSLYAVCTDMHKIWFMLGEVIILWMR